MIEIMAILALLSTFAYIAYRCGQEQGKIEWEEEVHHSEDEKS